MSTIVLRSVKGTPLTNTEVDTNFSNLNTDKLEASTTATLTNKTINLTSNTLVATSAQLAAAVTDETGTGALVFANSPTFVTPALGTPSSGTLTNATGLPISTGVSGLGTGVATFLATPSSANLRTAVTDETGSGALVFGTSPTLASPAISGTVTDTTTNLVTQADIGTAANEIPLNQYLGSMAYQDGTNYYNVGMTVGFRNRIINGAMMIDQRNAGASVTVNTFNVFAVDRFNLETGGATGGGVYTAQRSTVAPSNFVNSLLCTVTTADSSLASGDLSQLSQYIEGLNIADLGWGTSAAKPVTLSFWVRSSVTGPFSVGFQNATNDRANVGVYTINTANTWEYKTITVSGDTSGTWNTSTGIGISLRFCFATGDARVTASPYTWVGANAIAISSTANPLMGTLGATFYITGVQLEVGTQATPFDWRPYGTEFALCQRYYFVYDSKRSFGTVLNSTDFASTPIQFPQPMRTNPTGVGITAPNITTTGNWGIYGATNGWGAAPGYTPAFTTTVDGCAVSMSGLGGVTNNYSYLTEGGAKFSAEL